MADEKSEVNDISMAVRPRVAMVRSGRNKCLQNQTMRWLQLIGGVRSRPPDLQRTTAISI